jgi:putative peptide zinc metalloprotease protein
MLARIKPTLASLLPWREPDPSVRVLKPWVRAAVSGYVLTLVPLVLLVLAMLVLNLPRMLATSWDSGRRELHTIATAAGAHEWPTLLVSCVQLLVLVLVPVGLGYTLAQLATKIVSGVRRATAGRPWARAGALAVAAGAAAFAAYSLLPSNGYRPIASGEKGTLAQAFDRLRPAHDHPGVTHPRGRAPAPAPVGRPRIGDGGAATPPARAPHRARPAAGRGRAHSASTTGRASPSAPPAPSESPPAGTSNPTVSTPAATVSTPAATVSVPSVTVTAPDAGATPPAVTATTPSATVTTPAATVTAPSVTVTTPTLPTPTVTTPSLP